MRVAAAMPTVPQRLFRVLVVVLVFIAVGPPVGGFVFLPTLVMADFGSSVDVSSMLLVVAFGLIYAVPLSYFIGALPAALTGCFVGAWLAFYGRMLLVAALATGIGAGLVMTMLSDRDLLSATGGPIDTEVLPIIAACFAGTMAAWAIVRTWFMTPPVMIRKAA